MLRPLVAEDPLSERLALFDLAAAGRTFNRPLYGGRTHHQTVRRAASGDLIAALRNPR